MNLNRKHCTDGSTQNICLSWLKFKETRVILLGNSKKTVQNLEQTRSLDASRSLLQHEGHPIVWECSVYVGSLEVRRLEHWYGDTYGHLTSYLKLKKWCLKKWVSIQPILGRQRIGSRFRRFFLWNELKEDPNRKHVFSRKTWIFPCKFPHHPSPGMHPIISPLSPPWSSPCLVAELLHFIADSVIPHRPKL